MGFLKKLFGEKRATSQSASATGFPYVYVNQDGPYGSFPPTSRSIFQRSSAALTVDVLMSSRSTRPGMGGEVNRATCSATWCRNI
jgi:hypothetical protein